MNSAGPHLDSRLAGVLAELQPDEFALRDRIAAQLDDAMLDEIAAFEWGADIDRYRDELDRLRSLRRWPDRLGPYPGTVLELMRPLGPEHSQDPRRVHIMRTFACLVLVRVGPYSSNPSESLPPLVLSAIELGEPVVGDALRFLAWCRLHEPGTWRDEPAERPLLTFAVLALATATAAEPAVLGRLAACLLTDLERSLAEQGELWRVEVGVPLLGAKPRAWWRRLWSDVVDLIEGAADPDIGWRLGRLGKAVRGDSEESLVDVRPLLAAWDG